MIKRVTLAAVLIGVAALSAPAVQAGPATGARAQASVAYHAPIVEAGFYKKHRARNHRRAVRKGFKYRGHGRSGVRHGRVHHEHAYRGGRNHGGNHGRVRGHQKKVFIFPFGWVFR